MLFRSLLGVRETTCAPLKGPKTLKMARPRHNSGSNTRLVMDNVVSLLPITNPMGTPIFSYADRPVKAGAVAGIAADDRKLGAMLAESVVDVLVNGKPISQVPVKMDPNPKLTINEPMMLSLGLKFPESIMKEAATVR